MCLAVPAQVVERRGDEAVVDLHGNRVCVNTLMVPQAREGDWVLIHAGFAIQRLDEAQAGAPWGVLEDIARRVETEAAPTSGGPSDHGGAS